MGRSLLLDIDGVLVVSWEPLPHAVDTVTWLDDQGIEFRLVTNTSSKTRGQIVDRLTSSGFAVRIEQVLTAVTSAAHYLSQHHPGSRCLVVNEGDLRHDLVGVEVVDAAHALSADVVLLGGAGPSVGYTLLDQAFKLALEGAPVIALHRNTRFQTADGPALDMGAFVVGLEAAASIDITVVGKPAPSFFHAALADLDVKPEETVVVGDDVESDVLGAQAVGITGVLVRTGKFRPSDLDLHGQPDYIIDDIGGLAGVLEHLPLGH